MADNYDEKKSGYKAASLPSYTAQTEAINSVYDRALAEQLAALAGSYATSMQALEAERPKIALEYQAAGNSAAASSERTKQAWGEYASASGLNSGAAGQAELARSLKLQGDLSSIRQSEAEANAALDSEILKLQTQYNNAVAKARAEGDYARASALLDEYQRAEQSRVSTAGAQADEDYRAYTSSYNASKDEQSSLAQEASTRAKYGDFSGYAALGYSQDAIAGMSAVWAMQNPLLAYNLGMISAGEYYRYTGKYPAGYGYTGGGSAAAPASASAPTKSSAAQSGGASGGASGARWNVMAIM